MGTYKKPSIYSKFFHCFNYHVVINWEDITLFHFSAVWSFSALRFGHLVFDFWLSGFYLFGRSYSALSVRVASYHLPGNILACLLPEQRLFYFLLSNFLRNVKEQVYKAVHGNCTQRSIENWELVICKIYND